MRKIIIFIFAIATAGYGVVLFKADLKGFFVKNKKYVEIRGAAHPSTYASMVITEDSELKDLAESLTSGCGSADNTCWFYRIYRYIMDEYVYIPDPGENTITGVGLTIEKKGGDCEDLTILMASLLENLNIRTYMALQPDHVYLYVCWLDKEHLHKMIVRERAFRGYNFTSDYITEVEINSERCIPVDPSDRGELSYPGQAEEGEQPIVIRYN